jgi:alkanesulfonate monooxygenase SsuD/methylene tetrahydromethanopterin reductase-like flavin-dependent oxidoreductase (luciferase family)
MAVRNHPDRRYPLTEVYEDYIGDGLYAEQLGFHHVWIGEHRMTPCRWTPSPVAVMTAIAARTEHIRIGTSIMCVVDDAAVRESTLAWVDRAHANVSAAVRELESVRNSPLI